MPVTPSDTRQQATAAPGEEVVGYFTPVPIPESAVLRLGQLRVLDLQAQLSSRGLEGGGGIGVGARGTYGHGAPRCSRVGRPG